MKPPELFTNPLRNKGTAFTKQERLTYKLLGLLPARVETLEEQLQRVASQLSSLSCSQQKIQLLHTLFQTNQVLFYKLITTHLAECLPLIYTPHVATTVQNFSKEFMTPYGLYLAYPDREHLATIFEQVSQDIELVIVTDGERVLGIGDQGVGGISIAVGKLMLYTALGKIAPHTVLPVVLDVGTNNPELLANPHYLGWRHPRVTGSAYDDFIAQFVTTLQQSLPYVLLHWEDFGRHNAARLLELYREKLCSFNDDIQGTAVVTLAALMAAINLKTHTSQLTAERIVFLGAGSSAMGIANLICLAMQRAGLTQTAAQERIWLLDIKGLVVANSPYAKDPTKWHRTASNHITLLEVVQHVKPTVLIGCSTASGAFTETIVREMAQHCLQPIIFPLSNPTANCEAHPQDLINWTQGQALIATGSPFAPVTWHGKSIPIAQCNNALVFPGLSLGALAVQATKITDDMLLAACETLLQATHHTLLPPIQEAPKVIQNIALAVATKACQTGINQKPVTDLQALIAKHCWTIEYS